MNMLVELPLYAYGTTDISERLDNRSSNKSAPNEGGDSDIVRLDMKKSTVLRLIADRALVVEELGCIHEDLKKAIHHVLLECLNQSKEGEKKTVW